MNPFTLTFKLRQHTPLIHFQHDQTGATLRATEVKPKLDKFIWEKWIGERKGKDNAFEAYSKFLTGHENYSSRTLRKMFDDGYRALEYKISIGSANKAKIREPYSLFFGNLDKENHEKKFMVFNEEYIDFTIFSLHASIRDIFSQKFITEFFFKHNFGTRQSKGFGSFMPEQINNQQINFESIIQSNKWLKYSFSIPSDKSGWHEQNSTLFQFINIFYKAIRSGINFKGLYLKSLIFLHANRKNWQWDKKSIKQILFYNERSSNTNLPLIRDVLGLATLQDWGYKYRNKKIGTEHLSNEIQRFQSPFFIKPVKTKSGYEVYFDWRNKEEGIWDKSFRMFIVSDSESNLPLTVPSLSEFDPDGFLRFIVAQKPSQLFRFRIDERQLNKIMERRRIDNHAQSSVREVLTHKDVKNIFDDADVRESLLKPNASLFDIINNKLKKEHASVSLQEFVNDYKIKNSIDDLFPNDLLILHLIFGQLNKQVLHV